MAAILRLVTERPAKTIPRKLNFTLALLAGIKPPSSGRTTIYDAKTPGLAYTVTSNGARSFYIIRRIHGRPTRLRLGGQEITIEQARDAAMKMHGEIAGGGDPAKDRREVRHAAPLGELWDRYEKEHLERRCSPKTLIGFKNLWKNCLSDWKSRTVSTITEADARALHTKIGEERGPTTANRAMEVLRSMYGWARIEPNPVRRGAVKMFREVSRARFVQPDELPKLFAALNNKKTHPLIRDYIYMSLWTGARKANVMSMHRDEINVAAATWTIPAGKSKSGEAITIPLVDPAMQIIHRRIKHPSGFIFPSTAKSGHLESPKRAWASVLERAGLADIRIHDLRRTFGSWQAAAGASLPIIGRSLGHRNTSATMIYSRLNIDPVRASMNAAVAAMTKAGKAKPARKPRTGKNGRSSKR